jgi:glycosyltransferase involved in cell wall biosynthesis
VVTEQITKIRVLRIIARMNVGGPAIQISGLMKNLDHHRFEQLLATGFCGSDEIDYLDEHKVEVPLIKVKGLGQRIHLMNDLQALLQIRKIIKKFKPDIVHTHTAKAGLLGRLAVLTIRKKIATVHTFHGHLLHGYFGRIKGKSIILLERLLASNTVALIAVGEKVRDELLFAKVGNADKYHIVGPGLEISKIPSRENARNLLGISPANFTVSWIGRAVAVKAPHRILEIAQECKNLGLNIRFLFVGNGPLESQLREVAIQKYLDVEFLGWQTNIEAILSVSDLVILTSLNEGTPVALIQAQMAGIPVVATSVGSTSEVMINGKTGYAVHYSKEIFASLIKEFNENPLKCKEFGESGKTFVLKKFSLQNLVKTHEELYLRILSQSNS